MPRDFYFFLLGGTLTALTAIKLDHDLPNSGDNSPDLFKVQQGASLEITGVGLTD